MELIISTDAKCSNRQDRYPGRQVVSVGASVSGAKNQTTDDWQAGGKVSGGYNIDQNWAVEAGHTRLGSEDFRVTSGGG